MTYTHIYESVQILVLKSLTLWHSYCILSSVANTSSFFPLCLTDRENDRVQCFTTGGAKTMQTFKGA